MLKMLKKLNGLLPFILLASYNPLGLFFIITEDKGPGKRVKAKITIPVELAKTITLFITR